MRALKWIMVIFGTVVLIGGSALYLVYNDYRVFLNTPLTISGQSMDLRITPGTAVTSIADRLEQDGILRSSLYLQVYARLQGLASRIQAGEYLLESGTTPPALMEKLVKGRVVQHTLTVVEGWTFRQMLKAIHEHPEIEPTLQGLDDAEIMERLGHPDEHPEGRFFPDTYHFPANTRDLAFLKRAYQRLEDQLQQAWKQKAPDLPLQTPYESLILASIIEKETGLASERHEIAGVMIRRLKKGMLLQSDPTVIYGMGEHFDGNIRRRDLRTDTPYNTYTRRGLPPTPIALAGAESIAAALDPAPGKTLYFVATGEGGHVFSKTLREHNRAVREYQLKRR